MTNMLHANKRFKIIHTMTGQTVARSDSLQELRQVIDQADAVNFTLHDVRDGKFSGASIIFKDSSNSKKLSTNNQQNPHS